MGALQPGHLIVVLVIVLIIFGPGKLPQLGKAVGDGIRELRHATGDESTAKPTPNEVLVGGPVAAIQTTWTCTQCQAVVPITDRFCGACGAAHDRSNKPATPSAAL